MKVDYLEGGVLYSIFLPRASYFLVVPPKIVGLDGAQEKSMK